MKLLRYLLLIALIASAKTVSADSEISGTIERIYSEDARGNVVFDRFFLKDASGHKIGINLPDAQAARASQIIGRNPSRQFHVHISDPSVDDLFNAAIVNEGIPTEPLITGAKNIAFVLFTIAGTTNSVTSADVTRSMQTGYFFNGDVTVSSIFSNNSYGTMTVGSQATFGPYTLPVTLPTTCSMSFYATLDTAFNNAMNSNGIVPGSYDYVVFVVPDEVGALCGWLGTTWGGNEVAVANNVNPVLVSHELGHLFGMGHSTFDADNNGVISGPDDAEYGDPTCIMGGVGKYYNLSQEAKQDWWYAAGGGYSLTPSGSTTYTIHPYESTPSSIGNATQLVQVNVSDGSVYFVTFAKNTGTPDSSYDLNDYSNNHVFVTRAYGTSSKTFLVSVLPEGASFSDDSQQIYVEFLSQSGTTASVRVTSGVLDSDGDGTSNASDTDDDNDGYPDSVDCADTSATRWTDVGYEDTDLDGYGNTTGSVTLPYCFGTTAPSGYITTSAGIDNCPGVSNPDQRDSDSDGQGDACESSGRPTLTITSGTKVQTTKRSYSVLGGVTGMGSVVAYCGVKAPGARSFSATKMAKNVSLVGTMLSWKCPVKTTVKGNYLLKAIGCDNRGCTSPKSVKISRK